MVEKVLEFGGSNWLVPILIATAFVWLVNQITSLHQVKGTRRYEFLQLWSTNTSPDDVWLEVAVRHAFGEYLPASVIRMLMRSKYAARALLEVSESWPLLEYREETDEIVWRHAGHRSSGGRKLRQHAMLIGYAVLMLPAAGAATLLVKLGPTSAQQLAWIPVVTLGAAAVGLLVRRERLKAAETAVPRWLGLP